MTTVGVKGLIVSLLSVIGCCRGHNVWPRAKSAASSHLYWLAGRVYREWAACTDRVLEVQGSKSLQP